MGRKTGDDLVLSLEVGAPIFTVLGDEFFDAGWICRIELCSVAPPADAQVDRAIDGDAVTSKRAGKQR
jgi:hypothetical protein